MIAFGESGKEHRRRMSRSKGSFLSTTIKIEELRKTVIISTKNLGVRFRTTNDNRNGGSRCRRGRGRGRPCSRRLSRCGRRR